MSFAHEVVFSQYFGSDGGDDRGEETGDGGKRGVGLVGKMVYTLKKCKPFSVVLV